MPGGSEGPNWILFAGGAAVTAISYIIGRRQRHYDRVEEREGKSGKAQLASHEGLLTGLALVHDTSTGGLDNAFHANNHQDGQRSPPSAEFSEEDRSFQSRTPSPQDGVRRSNSQGVQIGRTPKRDMVHRLRKQLKSRDEMILSMQVQISEYERSLSLSDAHMSELQARLEASERSLSVSAAHVSELQEYLEASGRVISDLDKEVQLLRNQLADLLKFDAKMEDCNQPAAGGAELVTSSGDERRDINATLFEFKKLRELSDRLKDETNAREIEWQALSQEHNSMLDKVDQLECALKEQKMLVSDKQQALDMNQVQLRGVTSKLQDIEHLLQAQIEETESLRHSNAKLEAFIHSLIKTQDAEELEAKTEKADKLIETRDTDELESNAPTANGLIKTENINELKANAPTADRLMETPDIDENLVRIFDSVSESGSETRDPIDSDFDEMLDGTLDDLVKICSTTVTPASTPTSSALSPNSGSRRFQYF